MDQERRDRHEDEAPNADIIARSMKAEQKNKQRETTRRMNKLWIWLGVLVLIIILLWWLFTIGFAESEQGEINGPGVENPVADPNLEVPVENQIEQVPQQGENVEVVPVENAPNGEQVQNP